MTQRQMFSCNGASAANERQTYCLLQQSGCTAAWRGRLLQWCRQQNSVSCSALTFIATERTAQASFLDTFL